MANKQDNHTAQFYVQFHDALQRIKRNEINIILSDFNAKIKHGAAEKVIGKYDLGNRRPRRHVRSILLGGGIYYQKHIL